MEQFLTTHGEVIMTFLLPKLLASDFISFMISCKATYSVAKEYLKLSGAKHGIITIDKNKYSYVNDQRHGRCRSKVLDKRIVTSYRNGMLHGEKELLYRNGYKTVYIYYEGLKHGIERVYDENGMKQRETPYVNGVKDGTETCYRSNGEMSYQITYQKDIPHGTYYQYNQEGKLRTKTDYANGKRHGSHIEYFCNGKVYTEQEYQHGTRQGIYRSYVREGHLVKDGRYDNDQKHGIWIIYEDNEIVRKQYDHGTLISITVKTD